MTAKFDIRAEIDKGYNAVRMLKKVQNYALIGSALYLPEANDVDFAVLINSDIDCCHYAGNMHRDGWGNCGDYDYDTEGGTWAAIRRENLNLMITNNAEFFANYVKAMEVCKVLGLKEKHQRIAVCSIIRDGKTAEEAWLGFSPMQLAAVKGHQAPRPTNIDVSDL